MYILLRVHLSRQRGLLKVNVCESLCVSYPSPAAGMCFPYTHPRECPPLRGHLGESVCPGCMERARCPPLVWGTRDRGTGRNYSQAPNTAVEISHDLPNSTFYILWFLASISVCFCLDILSSLKLINLWSATKKVILVKLYSFTTFGHS